MALIKCHECGNEVSTEATACPKCGAKPKAMATNLNKNLKGSEVISGLVFGVFVIWVLSSIFSSNPSASSSSVSPPRPALAPEMIVQPVSGQFLAACQTKEKLGELLTHKSMQEKTKFAAMFDSFDCTLIPVTEKYKILSVYDHMVEVVNVDAKFITAEGMWAIEEAFSPAQ